MNFLKKIVIFILQFLERNIPKSNILMFISIPDFSDNSYAIYSYIKSQYGKKYKLIWLVKEKSDRKIKQVEFNSIISVFYYLRSKYVFSTHYSYDFIKKSKENEIMLWHGMPLKKIGLLDERIQNYVIPEKTIVATSPFFKEIMSKSFGIDKNNIEITGQPRNDLLFQKSYYFRKRNIKTDISCKTIMWMPTFRKTIYDVSWGKDSEVIEGNISILPINKFLELNNCLKENNIILIIKLHPFDILQKLEISEFSNIIIIKNNELEKYDEQLYPLLGNCDALITDYSSVWIDYEILNKPIFFAFSDYEEYYSNRGLNFIDFIDISPCKILQSYEDLESMINNFKNISIDNNKITYKYNTFKDAFSCERICKILQL